MEPRETALEDFLKAFRISLNFILLYSSEHKSFLKSLSDVKDKVEALFAFYDPITIAFLAGGIGVSGAEYSKIALHRELGALFHQRKIRSLTLNRGVTAEELKTLLSAVARPPKEIIRAGGVAALVEVSGGLAHCGIEELDYSQLLKGGGEDVQDVWAFMLKRAVSRQDQALIDGFIENFESMAEKVRLEDLLADEELYKGLKIFLEYLATHDRKKLLRVTNVLLGVTFKEGVVAWDAQKASRVRELFKTVNEKEFARLIWDRIATDERFDASAFEIFSRLLEADSHERIASGINDLAAQHGRKLPASLTKKIRELFFGEGTSVISAVYRKALAAISAEHAPSLSYAFDRAQITYNYRFILLDLLMAESSHHRLEAVLTRLLNEWDAIVAEQDSGYWRCLLETVQVKGPECAGLAQFDRLRTQLFNFLEALSWEETVPEGFQELTASVTQSAFDAETYTQKIFEEHKVSPRILELYFRFFGSELPLFYACLERKRGDLELVSRIAASAAQLTSAYSRAVLENIFTLSSDVIKLEVLQAMAQQGRYDRQFVFEVLRTANLLVRKEAFLLLSDQQDIQKAIELLLSAPNPWAQNNRLLLENLDLLVEARCRQAREYLENLERTTAFWNFPLKNKIRYARERL